MNALGVKNSDEGDKIQTATVKLIFMADILIKTLSQIFNPSW